MEITFGEFIKKHSFKIPDYQRAYSWSEKQLIPFINDILEHHDENNKSSKTRYYFGHYILEKPKEALQYEIVDGQQRISTVYLFLLACGYLNNENYVKDIEFNPVSYDALGLEEIKDILLKKNDTQNELELFIINSKTSSLKRMAEAVQIFIKAFSDSDRLKIPKSLNIDYIENYLDILNKAYCSVAVFNDKSVASQIFELHNTRGVKLTETEKVKALLMKNIYIHSPNEIKADININEIQENFANIYELEEKASKLWLRGDMPLDTILMYHLRAIEDGTKTSNFGLPQAVEGDRGSFEYIKQSLLNKSDKDIVEYAKNFGKEFSLSMKIIANEIPNADNNGENNLIGDILLLDKPKSLVFLLRAFRSGSKIDYKLIERWENFVLSYDIIYWSGFFYRTQNRGHFDSIYAALKTDEGFNECSKLLEDYYKGAKSFGAGWGHLGQNTKKSFIDLENRWGSSAYGWTRTGYFLYKYEIYNGAKIDKIRKDIFKDDKVSIDHIVAQGLSWDSLGFDNYNSLVNEDEVKKEADFLWNEILSVINGVGNLALSTSSNNSSDSNGLPGKHIYNYEKMGLIKTVEEVKTWKNPQQFVKQINDRTKSILNFVENEIVNKTDIWE